MALGFFGLILFLLSSVTPAQTKAQKAEREQQTGFIYGLALGIQREIYKDFDKRVMFFPVLGYRG